MKKALVLLALLGMAVYVASRFWARDDVPAAAARPWPNGLGTLPALPDRYPPQSENEAARKLTKLAGTLAENDAITAYVRQEIGRGEVTIGQPPTIADLSAIRDLLLHEPVLWERDLAQQHGGLLPNVAMYRSLSRALVASALGRARHHDAAAWEDLHAAWNLTKSLDGHPHRILRIVSMSITRAINAVAWKMPLPAPAWFDEVQQRDFVPLLFETLQFESWRAWRQQRFFPSKRFVAAIDRDITLIREFTQGNECELDRMPETPDLDITWQRAFRYRAEREATANALRARAGQAIAEESRCSDGRWSFDGTTLRFAKVIPLPEKIDTSMPLTLLVRE